jgi:hypothetical protein
MSDSSIVIQFSIGQKSVRKEIVEFSVSNIMSISGEAIYELTTLENAGQSIDAFFEQGARIDRLKAAFVLLRSGIHLEQNDICPAMSLCFYDANNQLLNGNVFCVSDIKQDAIDAIIDNLMVSDMFLSSATERVNKIDVTVHYSHLNGDEEMTRVMKDVERMLYERFACSLSKVR